MYYGAIGDGVNLCARLEALNNTYGTWIIVSETSWSRVKDRCEGRLLDKVVVMGKDEGIVIYELMGLKGEPDQTLLAAARRYEEAFALYLEQRWDSAIVVFE